MALGARGPFPDDTEQNTPDGHAGKNRAEEEGDWDYDGERVLNQMFQKDFHQI
jgi:hypothetical protein